MDDLSRQIGELREEVRAGFKETRSEVKEVRSEAHKDLGELRAEINIRFDSVHASITTLWATTFGGFAALLAALIVTQL